MFARHQPSSPLASTTYPNTRPATALKTPSKHDIPTVPHQSHVFPPPLGSSSPPVSSPTSYRDHPSFTADTSLRASDRSRSHSSAGLFAARARASLGPSRPSVAGSGGTPFGGGGEGSRYGTRPGLKKALTGFTGLDPGVTTSTGYALHRPLAPRHASERSASHVGPATTATTTATSESLPGSMWKGKFRKRCLAVSQRRDEKSRRTSGGRALAGREGSLRPEDAMGESQSEGEADAEAEHEEIFRRMIQKEHRKRIHSMRASYDAHVGGSDPAVWEAEIRDAERDGFADGLDDQDQGTPERSAATSSQWQYRSASKGDSRPDQLVRDQHSADDDPLSAEDDEQRALAQFLLEQEEEETARIEAYASSLLFTAPAPLVSPDMDVGTGVSGDGDTPGGVLGVEMEGFTWEDAPLSDEERARDGSGDVEMS